VESLDSSVIAETQVPQQPCEDSSHNEEVAPSELHFTSLEDDSFGGLSSDIGQPILLGDQDPLNFSIDQGVLNITAAQVCSLLQMEFHQKARENVFSDIVTFSQHPIRIWENYQVNRINC